MLGRSAPRSGKTGTVAYLNKEASMQSEVIKLPSLLEKHLNVRPKGGSEVFAPDFSRAAIKDGVVHWDPGVDGVVLGESRMAESADHAGERHVDGDEILYLISGRMRLIIELQEGRRDEVEIAPGETVVVPRDHWHRLEIEEPAHFLFFGGGRTELRMDPSKLC